MATPNIEKSQENTNQAPENTAQMAREIYRLAGLAIEKITGALNTVSGIEKSQALQVQNRQEEYVLRKNELAVVEPKILVWQQRGYIA